jgi:hypothetical protein
MTDQTYLFVARVPAAGLEDYRQFIARVYPLIADSGGRIERRFASDDATIEVFVVSFPNIDVFEKLQTSAHIDAAAPLLYRSGARFDVMALAHNPVTPPS